ncbi:MAG: ABC transporter permease [Candidatus Poribacteria bacterium]|nr:ABC transporter permease [Candidatus Poribacteria bacterium]
MLMTLIQKEMMHHILSVRFVALLLMCLLLVPLTLHINYRNYLQNQVNYQESIKLSGAETEEKLPDSPAPDLEVSKLFLEPTPLSVFAKGLEESLPSYLGMTRNGVKQGSTSVAEAPLSSALGNLDFLFVVSTVFSLLALLFTFDAVAGEKEAGTLRITLANALPRDLFLWSKLIGGYIVFVVPFLVSFLLGLLLLVSQGFPLGESDIFLRVCSLTLVSLLYIGVFFAIGTVISTYLDNSKTALIIAFTVWVLAVLIAPRVGFLTAKLIAPTRAIQSVHMEKTAIRNNLNAEKEQVLGKKITETLGTSFSLNETLPKIKELREPIDAEYRQKFQEQVEKLEREYQREKKRQESVGETFSRITPTSSLIYLAMNLAETGKIKRNTYFQAGNRYYIQLEEEYFSEITDDDFATMARFVSGKTEPNKIAPPPDMAETSLSETLRHSVVDLLLLCFLAVVLTTVAFLKFFRLDI